MSDSMLDAKGFPLKHLNPGKLDIVTRPTIDFVQKVARKLKRKENKEQSKSEKLFHMLRFLVIKGALHLGIDLDKQDWEICVEEVDKNIIRLQIKFRNLQ